MVDDPSVVVQWLEQMGDAAERGPKALVDSLKGKRTYRIEALIELLSLACILKNTAHMRSAIVESLRLTLPPAFHDLVAKVESKDYMVPHASTISRHRLTVDMGFCKRVVAYLRHRLLSEDQFVLWAMADSSYRGQREWMLQCYRLATVESVRNLSHRCDEIERLLEQLEPGQEMPEYMLAQVSTHTKEMQNCVWEHVLVPLALGKGRMALEFKLPLLYHALRIEADSWSMVKALIGRMVSMTTDFGTESGYTRAAEANMDDLFPFWSEASIQDDGGDDVASGQDAPLISLQHVLGVPGIMHQVSTMLDHVAGSMSYWSTYRALSSHVSQFLTQRAAKDLMKASLFDDHTMHLFAPLDGFSTHFYEARFGSVVEFASSTLVVRGVLSQFWSKEKLLSRQRAIGEHACDTARVREVDRAFTTQEWWGFSMALVSIGGIVSELQY